MSAMARVIFALLFWVCTNVSAQSPSVDELERAMKKHGLNMADYYNRTQSQCNQYLCTFDVSDTITPQTTRDFKAFLEKLPNSYIGVTVYFSSPGGDVDAAMELGRLMRRREVTAASAGGQCSSACVLAFVGAVSRTAPTTEPIFGIHTPFSMSTREISADAAQKKFQSIGDRIRTYLREMNIPEALYEEMLRYPSTSMHYLTPRELSQMRILGRDPAYQDRMDSENARRRGLDKFTYLKRKVQVDIECDKYLGKYADKNGISRYTACQDAILGPRK